MGPVTFSARMDFKNKCVPERGEQSKRNELPSSPSMCSAQTREFKGHFFKLLSISEPCINYIPARRQVSTQCLIVGSLH